MTSKKYGGKLIGMSEYCEFRDRDDEALLQVITPTNKEQNWKGNDEWSIQLHYCNLYITEKQNILCCIQCGGVILEYETFKYMIHENLYDHYDNFKKYAETQQVQMPRIAQIE
jgi:hypothetical protein